MGRPPERKHMTTQEAADRLGLSRPRVQQMVRDGKFAHASQAGKVWLIPREDVEKELALREKRKTMKRKMVYVDDTDES